MTQRTSPRRLVNRVLAFTCAITLSAASSQAAIPSPSIAFDFGKAKDGVLQAGEDGLLSLRVGKTTGEILSGKEAVRPVDPAGAARWLAATSPNEFSSGFWIRFDRLPSAGSPVGLFGVSADEEGFVTIRLFAREGEFQGDYLMKSRTPVRKGEWHHVEFNYSKLQWRASLYLDGRFQWENDTLTLPDLRFGPLALVDGFDGAIRDLRCYDMALPSEYLAISPDVATSCAVLEKEARETAAKASNGYLKEWLSALAKRAGSYIADPGAVTVAEVKELKRDLGNAKAIAAIFQEKKNLPGRVATSPVTAFTVDPLSQEPYLPYAIPDHGEISGQMRLLATRGEFESGSALLFAFKPSTIRKVSISDLRGPDGKTIPAKNVDAKLIKRWFRSGGAWLSYHSDRRQRNLVPDLLVNDDKAIRVDEWRRRNYLRLDYPEGTRYVDISDPAKGHISWENNIPFRDADTIQPVEIEEAGRNQQFYFTVQVPSDAASGTYRGQIYFEGPNVSLELVLKVLPFDLPTQPSTYYDLEKTMISHMNSLPKALGPTAPLRKAYMEKVLAMVRAHNLFHTTGLWDSDDLVDLSRKAGFVPDKIFGTAGGGRFDGFEHYWPSYYPGLDTETLTSEDKKKALEIIYRHARPWQAYFKKHFPADAEPYVIFHSESSPFVTLNTAQGERAEVAHKLGQKVFAHGWKRNLSWAGAIQDMQSITSVDNEEQAAGWHATGGELISYSDTFPGSENPFWFRKRIGFRTYKAGYDGEMLHGFLGRRVPWNEFSTDLGGDGNYRNFSMAYPQQDGFITKLALEGLREAYDDLRYATRLRQLALANRDSKDNDLRRESRRQLLWLENLDGKTADPQMARLAITDRICILQKMIETRKGILPPADKVAKR